MDHATRRAIVDLLPLYAHNRRSGWAPESITHDRLTLAEYLLLRRVAIERIDMPVPFHQLRANALDPYSTTDPFLDGLPQLVARQLLSRSEAGYTLTHRGHDILARGEHAANDYAAARMRLPARDLAWLASELDDLAVRLHESPEPVVKAHQDRVPILRRFDPRRTAPIRLEYAIYALQRARDDAHISAWRAAGFQGPDIEVLTHLWHGDASTRADLERISRPRLRADHLAHLLELLDRDGLITHNHTSVAITNHGRWVRDMVEDETDRVFSRHGTISTPSGYVAVSRA